MTELSTGKGGEVLAISVPGDILSTNAPALRARLTELMHSSGANRMEIDLRAAAMIDSVGLNLLVWAWKAMRERKGGLRLRISSPDIERILRFTRLSNYIEVVRESR